MWKYIGKYISAERLSTHESRLYRIWQSFICFYEKNNSININKTNNHWISPIYNFNFYWTVCTVYKTTNAVLEQSISRIGLNNRPRYKLDESQSDQTERQLSRHVILLILLIIGLTQRYTVTIIFCVIQVYKYSFRSRSRI